MQIKKQEQVIEVKDVVIGYKCDNCNEEVNEKIFPDEWHNFTSGHNEWGNESYESIEYHHVCSPECYEEKLINVVEEDMEGIFDGEVDGMEIQFARRFCDFLKRRQKNI